LLWAGALQISAQHNASGWAPTRGGDAEDSPKKMEDTGAFMVNKGFELSFATTGPDGLALVQKSAAESKPLSVAIVDISIGPDFDGVETVRRIWAIDPEIQIILCAQHFDYSWSDIANRLPKADSYLILRKPFHKHEVVQFIYALTEKWTLRREIEEANEKRYWALYHDAPAMFFTYSRCGVVLLANDYAVDQLGYAAGAVEGKPWKELHPSGVRGNHTAHLRACLANPESVSHWEGPKICHDGTSRWVGEASRVVIAPSGELTVLSVCNDITQT
jgi:PAS domain S-box-containing protein